MEQSTSLQDFIALIEVGMMAITVYLTVVTGYLVAAYMVGPKLSKSQLIIVTLLFLLFALIFGVASFMFFNSAMNVPFDDGSVGNGILGWAPLAILSGEFLGMVAAMKFMFDIRKKK